MPGRRRLSVLIVLALFAVFVLTEGCGSAGRTVRPDDPPTEELAGGATLDVSIRAETPPDAIPLPHSVADEDRGRWLTLFVIDFTLPPKPAPVVEPEQ